MNKTATYYQSKIDELENINNILRKNENTYEKEINNLKIEISTHK